MTICSEKVLVSETDIVFKILTSFTLHISRNSFLLRKMIIKIRDMVGDIFFKELLIFQKFNYSAIGFY
jgi:hypothetical protein